MKPLGGSIAHELWCFPCEDSQTPAHHQPAEPHTVPMIATTFIFAASLTSTSPPPRVLNPSPVSPLPIETTAKCEMSETESALLLKLLDDSQQRRTHLRCNQELQAFAQERARDMIARDYFAHITPDRVGPNQMLRDRGYPLPSIYGSTRGNNVEAIAAGLSSVDEVWKGLIDSKDHRAHILGEMDFYLQQDEVGIAHIHDQDSEYGDYWVVIIARRERPNEARYACTPEPAICVQINRGSAKQ